MPNIKEIYQNTEKDFQKVLFAAVAAEKLSMDEAKFLSAWYGRQYYAVRTSQDLLDLFEKMQNQYPQISEKLEELKKPLHHHAKEEGIDEIKNLFHS